MQKNTYKIYKKTLNEVVIEGTADRVVKKLTIFYFEIRNKSKNPTLFNIILEVLSRATRQGKKVLFVNNILYIYKTLKTSPQKTVRNNKFSTVEGYKYVKSIVLL